MNKLKEIKNDITYLKKLGFHQAITNIKIKKIDNDKSFKKIKYDRLSSNCVTINNKLIDCGIFKLSDFPDIPPMPVLKKLEKTIEKNLFQDFIIIDKSKNPDPILIGVIDDNYYIVSQWGKKRVEVK